MVEFSIAVRGLSDIAGFVEFAQVQPFTITVGNEYQQANGKGHMGLCALDYSQPTWIWSEDCTPESWQAFCKGAEKYILI